MLTEPEPDMKIRQTKRLICIILILLIGGCQSAYYGALEKVGIHKRDVLVSRVENTRDSQQEAKEQFQSALEQFKSVVQFDGGQLENLYEQLNDEYVNSQRAAEEVSTRIDDVESVSEALFDEWEDELSQYSSESLRSKSRQQLSQTKRQYKRLLKAMRNAETSMDKVLRVFNDHVLFLKHNLNAKAISSIKDELKNIEFNVTNLIKQMNKSISEADQFINEMNH